jgi:hypothetical protein
MKRIGFSERRSRSSVVGQCKGRDVLGVVYIPVSMGKITKSVCVYVFRQKYRERIILYSLNEKEC